MTKKFPITKQGFQKLEEELKYLKHQERPRITKAIATARDQGDLSENAEYHAAREQQSLIEGRILDLEDKKSRAEVIEIKNFKNDMIVFGATVHLVDEDTGQKRVFTVVGEYESDISKGLISTASPLGKALIGKKVGDIIEVVTPKGDIGYEILKIEHRDT
jgi:transcription elongation factor GreA